MNTNQKVEGSPSSGIGVVVRYFLRRLAMAHRKSAKPRVQYANALAETVLVFVALPIAGITSFFLVISAKWGANPIIETLGIAPQIGGIVFGALAMLVGYLLLNKRMKKYIEEDPACYLRFGTEKDAQIVFWQKVCALIVCGVVPLFLGVLVLALV